MSGGRPKRVMKSRKEAMINKGYDNAVSTSLIGRSVTHKRVTLCRSNVESYFQKLYTIPSFYSLHDDNNISLKHSKMLENMSSYKLVNKIENYSYNSNTPYAIIHLKQRDFDNGTVRITRPGIYVLQEDIIFNPNPENDFQPLESDILSRKYSIPGPYQLGFFAAITVESNDVILDLNHFTIQQSNEHFIQQRFYANIELGSSPFIMNQGPSSGITGNYRAPKNIVVMNGILGLTSHHGIHGNLMTECLLQNLYISDFQVAGIALNGGSNNIIYDVIIDSTTGVAETSFGVPINFQYSQARFIRPFLERLHSFDASASLIVERNEKTINDIISELNDALEVSYNAALGGNNEEIVEVFRNKTRLSDGQVYGLLLNVQGVAVHGFLSSIPEGNVGNVNNYLKNITVKNIKADPAEMPVIVKYENLHDEITGYSNVGVVKGPVGDVFDITNVINDDGSYKGNVLANAQAILGKYQLIHSADGLKFGTTMFDQRVIDWIENADTNINEVVRECPESTHDAESEELKDKLVYKYGLDGMAHVMKGNFGLFLSGAMNTTCLDVDVDKSTFETSAIPPHPDANADLCIIVSNNVEHIKNNVKYNTIFEK